MKKIVSKIMFILGILLLLYPLMSNLTQRAEQKSLIHTYENKVNDNEEYMDELFKKAQQYNSVWCQTQGAIVGDSELQLQYEEELNVMDDGIMGSIEIPKISVSLPIHHGTEEDVLKNGVGHFEDSALPVGGENTRCILTAHRGLPNSKLFTRLDELEDGDLFFLKICNQTLAYQVNEIQVIKPDELNKLQIKPEEDLVSLITCTPYGINTHRLVVTGTRVPYEKKDYEQIQPKLFSARELIFTALPFIFIAIEVVSHIKGRKRWKHENEKS